ncbi:fumarylacetoacetate hydrolase family protein [Desulfocurvus sp. DL9XJH121]
MRIIRVGYGNMSFYAQLLDDGVLCLDKSKGVTEPLPLSEVRVMQLAVPSKIVCLDGNYRSGLDEAGGRTAPAEPRLYLKPPTAVVGHGQAIRIPPMSSRVEFAGVLGVVMGRICHNVAPEDVPQAIFGYTCANDVTARDLAERDGCSARAKGFDSFAPVGPWIETEVADPAALRLRTLVNGEVRQDAPTSEMLFSVPEAVSFVSRIMTLMPGDVLLTGTPAGSGHLAPGDEVSVEIEGVGYLSNPVRDPRQEEDADGERPLQ